MTSTEKFGQRAGRSGSKLAVLAGVLSLAGCIVGPESAAAERGRTELTCATDLIVLQRADLSAQTYEVTGCGKTVRYTCRFERGTLHASCLPEPFPEITLNAQPQ
jgi:hypothetical protein